MQIQGTVMRAQRYNCRIVLGHSAVSAGAVIQRELNRRGIGMLSQDLGCAFDQNPRVGDVSCVVGKFSYRLLVFMALAEEQVIQRSVYALVNGSNRKAEKQRKSGANRYICRVTCGAEPLAEPPFED